MAIILWRSRIRNGSHWRIDSIDQIGTEHGI